MIYSLLTGKKPHKSYRSSLFLCVLFIGSLGGLAEPLLAVEPSAIRIWSTSPSQQAAVIQIEQGEQQVYTLDSTLSDQWRLLFVAEDYVIVKPLEDTAKTLWIYRNGKIVEANDSLSEKERTATRVTVQRIEIDP